MLTIPLYEAGRVYSSVREAKHVASQRRLEVIQAGRSVRESVSISWNNLVGGARNHPLGQGAGFGRRTRP